MKIAVWVRVIGRGERTGGSTLRRMTRAAAVIGLGLLLGVTGCDCGGGGGAGTTDSGPADTGPLDAGADEDAGPPDAGPPDAGPPDAGPPDAGPPDAGPPDAGPPDAGPPDAGPPDAGPPDAGPLDAGSCCDRLGTTTSISWQASDGVLPHEACPPWELADSADPEEPILSGGAAIVESSSDGESMLWIMRPADITPGATVVVEARMRLVSGSASVTNRAPAVILGVFGPMARKWALQIEDGAIFLNSDESVRGPVAAIDTTTAPRTYRIEVDVGTGAVAVLVDGVPTLTGSTFPDPAADTDRLLFGEGSFLAFGRSEWLSFSHDAFSGCLLPP